MRCAPLLLALLLPLIAGCDRPSPAEDAAPELALYAVPSAHTEQIANALHDAFAAGGEGAVARASARMPGQLLVLAPAATQASIRRTLDELAPGAPRSTDAEVRVVHYQQIDVDNPSSASEFGELWDDIRDGQGNLSNTSTHRSVSGGDMVVLLVEPQGSPILCGIAGSYGTGRPLEDTDLSDQSAASNSKAFAVVSVLCAAGDLTFNHELGHNLGGWHDHTEAGNTCGINSESCGYFRAASPNFRTIMSVDGIEPDPEEEDEGFPCAVSGCPRVNRWSNYEKTIVQGSSSYPLGRCLSLPPSPANCFNPSGSNDRLEGTINETSASFVSGYRTANGSAPGSVSTLLESNCFSNVTATYAAGSGVVGWYEAQRGSSLSFSPATQVYKGGAFGLGYSYGSNHYLRVRACNVNGCSGWSNSGLINVSQCP